MLTEMHSFSLECALFLFRRKKKSLKLHLMWKMNPVCQRLWSLSICFTFTSVIYSDPSFCFVLSTCNVQLTCTSLSPVYFQGATEIMKKNTGIKKKKIVTKFILCTIFDIMIRGELKKKKKVQSEVTCKNGHCLCLYIVCTVQCNHFIL